MNFGAGQNLGLVLIPLGLVILIGAPTVSAQFNGIALVSILALDLFILLRSRRRLNLKIEGNGVFVAGAPIPLRIHGLPSGETGRRQLRIQPMGKGPALSAESDNGIDFTVELSRGHHEVLQVRSHQGSTLGLFCLARLHQCRVDVIVGPRRGEIEQRKQTGIEWEVGGVRVAQSADPRRLVHWPSSAKTQQLMVKDTAPTLGQDPSALSIVVDLDWEENPSSEAVTERARAYAEDALRQGRAVDLVTARGSKTHWKAVKAMSPSWKSVDAASDKDSPPTRIKTSPVRSHTVTRATVTRVNSQREILEVLANANSGLGALPEIDGERVHVSIEGDQWSAS